jgi:hypothetical protein
VPEANKDQNENIEPSVDKANVDFTLNSGLSNDIDQVKGYKFTMNLRLQIWVLLLKVFRAASPLQRGVDIRKVKGKRMWSSITLEKAQVLGN